MRTPLTKRIAVRHLSPLAVRLCCASIAGLFLSTTSFAAPPGWNPTFSDEFDGTSLDTTKWDPILWYTPHNNERQAYHPSRATVADGHLALTADDSPLGGKQYASGKVESKFVQQYGRWEIRAKLPGTRGTWPAIWLLPDTSSYGWPTQGEIDILENRGTQPNLTSAAYHFGSSVATHQYRWSEQRTSVGGQLADYHDEFHTYAVEWDPAKLRFFVDDVHWYTIHDSDTNGFLGNQTAPMETVLNVAVGGDFLGSAQPDGTSSWPQQMLVDYVRVYQRDENPPPAALTNAGFEANGGALAGWSTFGSTLSPAPNVQVHNESTLSGDNALKLFGQFNNQENYSGVSQGITVAAGDRVEAAVNTFIRSQDSIAGSQNEALLKIEFYNEFGGKYGSPDMVGELVETIADGSSVVDQWTAHDMSAVAPAGAVEARVVLLFRQRGNDPGAVHFDDVSFSNLDLAAPADANGDGQVDGEDFLGWQRDHGALQGGSAQADFNFDGGVDGGDLALWQEQFGGLAGGVVPSSAVVAEPSGAALAIATLLGLSEARVLLLRQSTRACGFVEHR